MKSLDRTTELVTFYVGNTLCGIDIAEVQEINKSATLTEVPRSPTYVRGIMNLRGQVVTVIDVAKKVGLGSTDWSAEMRHIIVHSQNGSVGLLVRKIGDVVSVDRQEKDSSPANMNGVQGKFFTGVFKRKDQLIGALDVESILSFEWGEER